MITYLYWIVILLLIGACVFFLAFKAKRWPAAMVVGLMIFISAWALHTFYLEQVFVKRWGGRMNIAIEEGHYHLGATWKDDHLWVETYDPATNTCYFIEYSRGSVLQGRVIFNGCNPLEPKAAPSSTGTQ